MQKHEFLCPYCKESEAVGAHMVGERILCSHCGSFIVVPEIGAAMGYRPREAPAAEAETPAEEATGRRAQELEEEEWAQRERTMGKPKDPAGSAGFLEVMAYLLVAAGIIAALIGLAGSASDGTCMSALVGMAILIQCLWLAAVTFLLTGAARNIFNIANRVRSMADREQKENG